MIEKPNKKPIKQSRQWSDAVKGAVIAGIFVVIAAVATPVVGWVLANRSPTPTPAAFSQGTVGAISSSPTSQGASPTPTPKVIPINQTMNCTNCTSPDFFNFSLKVKSATIDPAKGQVTLLIEVVNITSTSQSDVFFYGLKLQDTQTGGTTDGGGDGFSSFEVVRPVRPKPRIAGDGRHG